METAVVTLHYKAHTAPTGYRWLEQALLDAAHLYNAIVTQRNYASSTHRRQYSRRQTGHDLTELHQHEPYSNYAHRMLTEIERQVNDAFQAYYDSRKDDHTGPKRRRPKTKDPYRRRTISINEPAVKHLAIKPNKVPQLQLWKTTEAPSQNGERGKIHIKGLPDLKLRADERLPRDRQPLNIDITLDAGQLKVGLAYELKKDWPEPLCDSAGIDPGKANTLTVRDSNGNTYHYKRPDETEFDKKKKKLQQKMQRQRDAAIKDGRARWTRHRNRQGQIKYRFRWNGTPSHSYLKTLRQLRAVERRRSGQRKHWSHQVSAELVKLYRVICWENTQIRNLTRSAHGTVEQPRNNVAQKRGLNRSILSQNWGQLRQFTEYKAAWASRNFVPVPARNTSITCAACAVVDKRNRRTQAKFQCMSCGHTDNADANAAENIRIQGLKLLSRADEDLASTETERPCAGTTTERGLRTGSKSQTLTVPAEPRSSS